MAAMEAATIISNMYFYMPKSPDLKEPMIQVGPSRTASLAALPQSPNRSICQPGEISPIRHTSLQVMCMLLPFLWS